MPKAKPKAKPKAEDHPISLARKKRNSKHDIPCGEDCTLYPRGKRDHAPKGFLGRLLACVGIDLQTRPQKRADGQWWVLPAGRRKALVRRHWECPRPNMFFAEVEGGQGGAAAAA
ncbi:hypothetical protein ACHAQA_009645 [Verticillium albo-atrum]